jgi:hypothetical protein
MEYGAFAGDVVVPSHQNGRHMRVHSLHDVKHTRILQQSLPGMTLRKSE